MKTIVYLHGYASSGQSGTVKQLRTLMPDCTILAPDIPVNPKEALPFLEDFCKEKHADLIIGTSMGGMYAMQLVNHKRICVNPALRMSELTDILKVGTFEYFQSTEDGKTHFTITEDTVQQFRDMELHMFDKLTDESKRRCWGFFGDEDPIAFRTEYFRHFFPNVQIFHGGHRMNNKILEKVILPFVSIVLNEEKTDEWGVTYSSFGRILKNINPEMFTCEEYNVPEGVEVIEDAFWTKARNLRRIHLPSTLRRMVENTFEGCPLEALELPEGIKVIPGSMCEGCMELESVKLPSSIEEISIAAFNGCKKLKDINLPDSIEYIEDNAFAGCISLTHIHLPSKLEWIARECFRSSGLISIDIPENVRVIGEMAFWDCDNLKILEIPATVSVIEPGIITAHKDLIQIVCKSTRFRIENDALIQNDNEELLCYWTKQKNYVVPSSVRRISSLSGNDYVETIIVNQLAVLAGYETFAANRKLSRITFKTGVVGIKDTTFCGCESLEEKPTDFW